MDKNTQKCKKCEEIKILDDFYTSKTSKNKEDY